MSALPVLVNIARPAGEVDGVRLAREARAAGLSGVGFADSPRLFPDPVVETSRVLAADDQVLAGPCALALPLGHVARAAGALATLAGHHPHRVVAVVGRGESSLANEGLAPPPLRRYAEMLATLRARLQPVRAQITVLGAASGPRTIEATARELGGVLLDVGASAAAVHAAARHAARANPDVALWAFVRVSVAADDDLARSAGTALLGSCASRMVGAPHWYGLSPEAAAAVAALAASHDYRRHGTPGATSPTRPAGGLGAADLERAADQVRERFIVAAGVDVVAARLQELAEAGLRGLVLAGGLPGVVDHLPELGAACAGLTRSPASRPGWTQAPP